jgi:hypothetical protein
MKTNYEEIFHGGFVFKNTIAAAQCGCGESFTIDRDELIEMKRDENQ